MTQRVNSILLNKKDMGRTKIYKIKSKLNYFNKFKKLKKRNVHFFKKYIENLNIY